MCPTNSEPDSQAMMIAASADRGEADEWWCFEAHGADVR
jgi:hypothetical protein